MQGSASGVLRNSTQQLQAKQMKKSVKFEGQGDEVEHVGQTEEEGDKKGEDEAKPALTVGSQEELMGDIKGSVAQKFTMTMGDAHNHTQLSMSILGGTEDDDAESDGKKLFSTGDFK